VVFLDPALFPVFGLPADTLICLEINSPDQSAGSV
jgi:hypothetical protein